MARTSDEWGAILAKLGVQSAEVARWAPVFAEVIDDDSFSLGDDEIDDFLGNVLVESQWLTRLEENLHYTTPERICKVFPSRVRTIAEAHPLVRNPRALAERVYGRRGDLGNETDADGWDFRGAGLIQVTGRRNTERLADHFGIDARELADGMRNDPATALAAAVIWWEGNVPDAFADQPLRIRKAVNGPAALEADKTAALARLAQQALQTGAA